MRAAPSAVDMLDRLISAVYDSAKKWPVSGHAQHGGMARLFRGRFVCGAGGDGTYTPRYPLSPRIGSGRTIRERGRVRLSRLSAIAQSSRPLFHLTLSPHEAGAGRGDECGRGRPSRPSPPSACAGGKRLGIFRPVEKAGLPKPAAEKPRTDKPLEKKVKRPVGDEGPVVAGRRSSTKAGAACGAGRIIRRR